MQTLKGHSDAITSVAFSHDSTQLASGSWDRTVKIWDASSGACLQTLEDHSSYVTSVVFTHDSARLASASDDSTIKIWDASSGECLQTHNTNKAIWKMSFDPTGLCLYTENGTVAIGASLVPNVTDVTDPRHAQHQNEGVSTDGAWITYNNKKRLWLPSEYRPSCSTTLGMHIGIGVGSGKVWICSLQLNESET
jgi:WD40 repeat protein